MSFAEVKKVNGSPALVIDGRAYPPMAMTTRFHKPEYIKRLGESGLKVFFLMTNTDCCGREGIIRMKREYSGMNRAEWRHLSGMRRRCWQRCRMLISSVRIGFIRRWTGWRPTG